MATTSQGQSTSFLFFSYAYFLASECISRFDQLTKYQGGNICDNSLPVNQTILLEVNQTSLFHENYSDIHSQTNDRTLKAKADKGRQKSFRLSSQCHLPTARSEVCFDRGLTFT